MLLLFVFNKSVDEIVLNEGLLLVDDNLVNQRFIVPIVGGVEYDR